MRASASTMLDRVMIERGHIRLATSVKSSKSSGDIITVTGIVLLGIYTSCVILCFTSNKYDAWIPWDIYNSGTMPELALFAKLLAERMYTAILPAGPLRDAGDFHAWLLKVSEIAVQCSSLEEFLRNI
jgi:hypothetical protein